MTVSRCVLEELYQGAVTLVFKRLPALNPLLNPSTPLVGIRIPSENFLLALSAMCSCPLALTSANKSSYESALAVEVVACFTVIFVMNSIFKRCKSGSYIF